MELCAQHKWMVFELGDFHQPLIRGQAREDHAGIAQLLPIGIAELKAMAVAFLDYIFPVGFCGQGTGLQVAWVQAQAHSAAFVGYIALVRHQVYYRVGCDWVEFG